LRVTIALFGEGIPGRSGKEFYPPKRQIMERNSFVKMHGLGNEYIVLDSSAIDFKLTTQAIKRLCNIHFGIGSDGIVMKVPSEKADVGFRVFNPDGSEAEKSGNGLVFL
jgi:diaminopimelate epimerase